MIGVDFDLFWTLNPKSLSPFIKAFYLQQKYDDVNAWKSGLYVQMAIASCFNKSSKYPPKPLMDGSDSREMSAEEIKEKMLSAMKKINTKFRKEESNG